MKALIDFAISSAEDSIMADYYPEAKRLFAVAGCGSTWILFVFGLFRAYRILAGFDRFYPIH